MFVVMKEEVSYGVTNYNLIQKYIKGLSGNEVGLFFLLCRDSEYPEAGGRFNKTPANLVYVDPQSRERWQKELGIKTQGGMSNLVKALLENDCIRKHSYRGYLINPNITFKGVNTKKVEAIAAYEKLSKNEKSEKVIQDKTWAAQL